LPLHELIAFVQKSPLASKKTWAIYNDLIDKFGNEFNVLLYASREELSRGIDDIALVDIIMQSREGKLKIRPGYDGVYGEIEVGDKPREKRIIPKAKQKSISDIIS
jgi:PHP family Zn ribbon phosphoesterase